jgi:hypothetical protein
MIGSLMEVVLMLMQIIILRIITMVEVTIIIRMGIRMEME